MNLVDEHSQHVLVKVIRCFFHNVTVTSQKVGLRFSRELGAHGLEISIAVDMVTVPSWKGHYIEINAPMDVAKDDLVFVRNNIPEGFGSEDQGRLLSHLLNVSSCSLAGQPLSSPI